MSNTVKGFTVTLKEGASEEYFDKLKEALYMFDGVIHVEPSINKPSDYMAKNQLKYELWTKMNEIFK